MGGDATDTDGRRPLSADDLATAVATSVALAVLFWYTLAVAGVEFWAGWPVGAVLLVTSSAFLARAAVSLRVTTAAAYPPVAVAAVEFWPRPVLALPEGLWWALVLAPLLATVGYAVGRATRHADDASDRLLLGRDRTVTRRWTLAGLALGAGVLVLLVVVAPDRFVVLDPPEPAGVTPLGVFGAAAVFVAAVPPTAVLAARNDGLAVCWLFALPSALAVSVVTTVFPAYLSVSRVLDDVLLALVFAFVPAVLGGTVGFLVGTGGRRAVARLRGQTVTVA